MKNKDKKPRDFQFVLRSGSFLSNLETILNTTPINNPKITKKTYSTFKVLLNRYLVR